ncbi:MAG: AAA family ATPase [Polyangiaceae bacterium]|nr:AAA family ATPase [Polyangiaceae bacterium]
MRQYHFSALAEHPGIAMSLQTQAQEAMRPFRRFLTQAIHTAKERQSKYEVKWQPAPREVEVTLTALDSAFDIPIPPVRYRLIDWPSGKEPNLNEPLVLLNRRGQNVRVTAANRRGNEYEIETESPVSSDDKIYWEGEFCRVEPTSTERYQPSIKDESGRPVVVRQVDPPAENRIRIVVEGVLSRVATVRLDGVLCEVHIQDPFEVRSMIHAVDENDRPFKINGRVLRTIEIPTGTLKGANGIRYKAESKKEERRPGAWVELLLPERVDDEASVDPRVAFCDGEIDEVWTEKQKRTDSTFRVKRVDRERYQLLLDRLPPGGSSLFLPAETASLHKQRRAVEQLSKAPLPHHRGLIRLCENPDRARWLSPEPVHIQEWFSLVDETRSGTQEQRRFVEKALGTHDVAILEGPPGSGKTTAICEIVQQLVKQGKRVLMCASTHVAIDNVLERLVGGKVPIDAVRVGQLDKVDSNVQKWQIDERVESLFATWRELPTFQEFGDGALREMAERTIVLGANLTCGTTMGILKHPLLATRREEGGSAPISTYPHFDVLLMDEASKTLIQEFLVPALLAHRQIIVGDIHQLPPFADRADLVANLSSIVDEQERQVFDESHQRACLLRHRLRRSGILRAGLRWLIVEPATVLDYLVREVQANPDPGNGRALPSFVRIVRGRAASQKQEISLAQLQQRDVNSLRLAAVDWVLVSEDIIAEAAPYLPGNLLFTSELTFRKNVPENASLLFRQARWVDRAPDLNDPVRERGKVRSKLSDVQASERSFFTEHTWAGEVAWRLTRAHELRWSQNDKERTKLKDGIGSLLPHSGNERDGEAAVADHLGDISDISLPSILEVLQEGIGEERARRLSSFTVGLPEHARVKRFEVLTYQHRMHPEISEFARDTFYHGKALKDANTIGARDKDLKWNWRPDFRGRRVWVDVLGGKGRVNEEEVRVMGDFVRDFLEWADGEDPPNRKNPTYWEVACLTFYVRQEEALREMLAGIFGGKPRFRYQNRHVEVVCGTVDRFQGREADLVLLSMRNVNRVGFLDSPNRLNVAVTRARQQLVVIGNQQYFQSCNVSELEALAKSTHVVSFNGTSTQRRPK